MGPPTEDQASRYLAAAHAVQAGTKLTATSAMDCRIGLNVSMAEHAAVAQLLVDKGVFSQDEYYEAIIAGVEREKARLETELGRRFGRDVRLV